jgi:hypothetical protein
MFLRCLLWSAWEFAAAPALVWHLSATAFAVRPWVDALVGQRAEV